ncbi:MAG: radical SAM protein [Pirellulaceae bacterium]|nr:MAG: radical SAM protein [Pirellulaceae bacterium]
MLEARFGRPSAGALESSPALVFYEITQACDLVCRHCRACAQADPHPGELTPRQARQLVDQLCEFPRPPRLIVTGGDPLKREDLLGLVEYATARGIRVSLTPSATPLVTEQAVARLAAVGLERLAISIDGPDAASHDWFRGVEGSFQHSLAILDWARRHGISTQINTTAGPWNYRKIPQMAELCERCRIDMWSVFFLVPVGRAEGLVRLTPEQYEEVFATLWHEAGRRPFAIKTTEAPHYRRYVAQQRKSMPAAGGFYQPWGLNDGKGVMFVSHTGWIYPSGFLPVACGLFPLSHLVQVYQQSPIFRMLRDASRLEGKCGQCEFRVMCGGSRARAYAVTGRLMAEEPDCAYVPRARPTS